MERFIFLLKELERTQKVSNLRLSMSCTELSFMEFFTIAGIKTKPKPPQPK